MWRAFGAPNPGRGNLKGGSGKSILAMHIIVALLKAGKRVASFDLDDDQQTLTHFIENRREWARQNKLMLELPLHCLVTHHPDRTSDHSTAIDLERFVSRLRDLDLSHRHHDFIVIDTAGGVQHLDLVARGLADTLVTPIGESLIDLDVVVRIGPKDLEPQLTRYAKTVARALDARSGICGRATEWIVVRNRLMTLPSRNEGVVDDVLECIRPKLGFRTARGLSEHLAFRELFTAGLTVFDPIHPSSQMNPDPATAVARSEVRRLVEQLDLLNVPPAPAPVRGAVRGNRTTDAVKWVHAPSLWPSDCEPIDAIWSRAEQFRTSSGKKSEYALVMDR